MRGDARNDLRLATGVLPGNRLIGTDAMSIPSTVNYRVSGDNGCCKRDSF